MFSKGIARGGWRGLLREADASNEAPSYSAGEAMTVAGLQRGTLETAKDTGERTEHELAESTSSVAEAGAELAAAVVSRIERPGLGPSAQNGTGDVLSRILQSEAEDRA